MFKILYAGYSELILMFGHARVCQLFCELYTSSIGAMWGVQNETNVGGLVYFNIQYTVEWEENENAWYSTDGPVGRRWFHLFHVYGCGAVQCSSVLVRWAKRVKGFSLLGWCVYDSSLNMRSQGVKLRRRLIMRSPYACAAACECGAS